LIEEDKSDSQEIENVTKIGEYSIHNATMIRVLNTGDSATKQQRTLIHKKVSRIKVASAELSGAGMDVITMHRYNWKPHNWTTFISPSLSRDEEVNSHIQALVNVLSKRKVPNSMPPKVNQPPSFQELAYIEPSVAAELVIGCLPDSMHSLKSSLESGFKERRDLGPFSPVPHCIATGATSVATGATGATSVGTGATGATGGAKPVSSRKEKSATATSHATALHPSLLSV
jgi:hypothetical protein